MFWKIWLTTGWLLEIYALWVICHAVRENRREYETVKIDMHVPGEVHYYDWLSGGAEEGELLEAAVLDTGFTDFYRLKVLRNQIVRRVKIDTVSFRLEQEDFPPIVKLIQKNEKGYQL